MDQPRKSLRNCATRLQLIYKGGGVMKKMCAEFEVEELTAENGSSKYTLMRGPDGKYYELVPGMKIELEEDAVRECVIPRAQGDRNDIPACQDTPDS